MPITNTITTTACIKSNNRKLTTFQGVRAYKNGSFLSSNLNTVCNDIIPLLHLYSISNVDVHPLPQLP